MSQPIFYITKTRLLDLFKHMREHPGPVNPHYPLAWGTATHYEQITDGLEALEADEEGLILLSKVHEFLHSFHSHKLIRGANESLEYYKRQVTARRSVKGDTKLWKHRNRY